MRASGHAAAHRRARRDLSKRAGLANAASILRAAPFPCASSGASGPPPASRCRRSPARLAAFRPEIYQPIGGADNVPEGCAHHGEQNAPVDQLAEGGGAVSRRRRNADCRGFIEQDSDPARAASASRRLDQMPGQLQRCASPPRASAPAWPMRRSQATSASGFSARCTSAWSGRTRAPRIRSARARSAIDFRPPRPRAASSRKRLPLQSGQRRIHVARNCISDVLETVAAAGRAAAVAGIEAEGAGGVLALFRERLFCVDIADRVHAPT